MRILNWNTQWLAPGPRSGRFARGKELIASYDADVICLTEARRQIMPEGGQVIASELSGAGNIENRGARKVLLWSRFGWQYVDSLGSTNLPEGRYVRAETAIDGQDWTIIGVCIPYHAYRNGDAWGAGRKQVWQGAEEYLAAFQADIAPALRKRKRTILLGDFNLQIPPFGYPGRNSPVNGLRKRAFKGWLIPTAGIRRHFVDHVAMSSDLRVEYLRFISKLAPDGLKLSDHNGVCLEVVAD